MSSSSKNLSRKRAVRSAKQVAKASKVKAAKATRKEVVARAKVRRESPAAAARFRKRKSLVDAVARGETVTTAARVLGVPLRSAFTWLAWHRDGGDAALSDGIRSGRPSKTSPETLAWLHKVIVSGDPRQLQFDFALWTLSIIRMALIHVHGLTLSKSTICRMLKSMGLSPQVPVYKSYKQSPGKVRYYLAKRYPKLEAWARAEDAAIYFADESRVRADGHKGTTWGEVGVTPVVADTGERFGVNMFSAITARGDMFFRCFEERMQSSRFIHFLRELRSDARKPILVVVDNGSYHTSKEVKTFLKTEAEGLGIRVAYLPPYSPELNPDEQVWNQAKREIGKRVVKTKSELRKVVNRALQRIKDSVSLVRSFFRLPGTRYAAGAIMNSPAEKCV
jgi:transposase